MSIATLLRRAGQGLLDLVFPPRCLVCHQPGIPLCDDCCRDFPRVLPPICQLCGEPIGDPGLCWRCRHTPLAIDGIRSVVLFEHGARQAIHQFKYRDRQALALPLARLMAEYWRANPMPADLITSVPLHPARQRERGYNQADLLAQAVGRVIGIPVGTARLKRVRHTRSQMSLNAADRRENVHNAFVCEVPAGGEVPAPSSRGSGCADLGVSGQRVLVVDDVCTTGSTLEACSVALKAAGASSVWGFTLARTAPLGVGDQRSEGSRLRTTNDLL